MLVRGKYYRKRKHRNASLPFQGRLPPKLYFNPTYLPHLCLFAASITERESTATRAFTFRGGCRRNFISTQHTCRIYACSRQILPQEKAPQREPPLKVGGGPNEVWWRGHRAYNNPTHTFTRRVHHPKGSDKNAAKAIIHRLHQRNDRQCKNVTKKYDPTGKTFVVRFFKDLSR